MANRLQKRALLVYVPAVQEVVGRPAYCETFTYQVLVSSGTQTAQNGGTTTSPIQSQPDFVYDSATGDYVGGGSIPGGFNGVGVDYSRPTASRPPRRRPPRYREESRTVCYPEIEAVAPEPARFNDIGVEAWNSGAQSTEPLVNDGEVSFTISGEPGGVLAGIGPESASTAFDDPTHAFWVRRQRIRIVENGDTVAESPVLHERNLRYKVLRVDGKVIYQVGNWQYVSALPSTGLVHLDASLFRGGDFVDSPAVVNYGDGDSPVPPPIMGAFRLGNELGAREQVSAQAEFQLRPFLRANDGASLFVSAAAAFKLDATVTSRLDIGVQQVVAEFTTDHTVVKPLFAGGDLPAITARTINAIDGDTAPIEGGGTSEPDAEELDAGISGSFTLQSFGLAPSGGDAEGELTMAAVVGAGSEDDSATMELDMAGMEGFASDYPYPLDYAQTQHFIVLEDTFMTNLSISARIYESVGVAAMIEAFIVFDAEVFEQLMVGDELPFNVLVEAALRDGLTIGDISRDVLANALRQYGYNTDTGAATKFSGYDFDDVATVERRGYGLKGNTLYRIGQGAVDTDAYVAFGDLPTETGEAFRMEALFFGMSTDGTVYAKVKADDKDRLYRVVKRQQTYRSSIGKGVSARKWQLTLQLVNATEASLDLVEYAVAGTGRRWTR